MLGDTEICSSSNTTSLLIVKTIVSFTAYSEEYKSKLGITTAVRT